MIPNGAIPDPPVLHPNEIDALYAQMIAHGQFYIGRLGRPPISISEWKLAELEKYAATRKLGA